MPAIRAYDELSRVSSLDLEDNIILRPVLEIEVGDRPAVLILLISENNIKGLNRYRALPVGQHLLICSFHYIII